MTLRETLKKQVARLGNPPLTTFGERAKAYWQKNRPVMAAALSKEDALDLAAIVAQEGMKTQIGEMVENGAHPDAARELAEHEWIRLENPEPPTPADRREGLDNQEEAFRTMLRSMERAKPKAPR